MSGPGGSRTRRRALAAALGAVAALAASGCGGGGSETVPSDPGARVFQSADCGTCHTLSASGARGAVGPNLDRLQPPAAVVARQVRDGGSGMPSYKSQLSPREIQAVARYVARASRG